MALNNRATKQPAHPLYEYHIICPDYISPAFYKKAEAKAFKRKVEQVWGCKWPHEIISIRLTETPNQPL